jgi:hypothetical protein
MPRLLPERRAGIITPMTRRFQFSLERLLASISAFCLAAAAFTNGIEQARQLKDPWPLLIGWMVGWTMVGLGIWCLLRPLSRK